MNPEQIAEYKQLKAKAEALIAKRKEGYEGRKLARTTYKEFFLKNASANEKKALDNKIASL